MIDMQNAIRYSLLYRLLRHTSVTINTLRPTQNGRHFADYIFKSIFLNEIYCILINI